MSGIFEALPGIEVPVGSISGGLDQMWSGAAADGRPAPPSEDAKAIQVNFVLLLGLRTDAGDAVRQFETAVSFSRRYPCRVVVLCPLGDDSGETEIRAKVYGECSVGRTPDDTRCCEFVMLSYPRSARPYLENEVSICQFLSRYPAPTLAGGLKSIEMAHGSEVEAEARVLLNWVTERMGACGAAG